MGNSSHSSQPYAVSRVRCQRTLLLIFLAGVAAGAAGFWLTLQNNNLLRYYLLDQPGRNQPQARIADFVQAVARKDSPAALALWEIRDNSPADMQSPLAARREEIIADLIARDIAPDYVILDTEWWRTCCEPGVINDWRNAGGARIHVQFMTGNDDPIHYYFDVFTRQQPYAGDAAGYPKQNWVIRDVYPADQQPLFWPLIYEAQIRSAGTAEAIQQ
jgi:hypothetical protein